MQRPFASLFKKLTLKPEAQILVATFAAAYTAGFLATVEFEDGYRNGGAVVAALGFAGTGRISANGLRERWDLYSEIPTLERYLSSASVLNLSGLILGSISRTLLHPQGAPNMNDNAMKLAGALIAVAGIAGAIRDYRRPSSVPSP